MANKSVKEREKIGNQGRIQAQHLSSSQYAENVLVVYNIAIKNKNKYRYGIFSKAMNGKLEQIAPNVGIVCVALFPVLGSTISTVEPGFKSKALHWKIRLAIFIVS